jgi:hypothetical protein
MNDNELDDVFRQAAERYWQELSEKDDDGRKGAVWEKLQEELNAPLSSAPARRGRWGYLAILLIVLLGSFTWLLYHLSIDNQQAKQIAGNGISRSDAAPSAETPVARKENKTSQPNAGVPQAGDKKDAVAKQENKKPQQEVLIQAPATTHKTHPQGSGAITGEYKILDNTPDNNKNNKEESVARIFSLPVLQNQPITISGVNGRDLIVTDNLTGNRSVSPPFAGDDEPPISKTRANSETELTAKMTKKENISAGRINHWYLGLTIGPDWNSAAGKGWGTGIGGGLKLSYRLNQKWAISTGVLLDKKIYDAKPSNYNPVNDSWRNYDVKSIDANCAVIDVPLNIEYTLWNRAKHRIFLSSGLSSFWMHEEKYTYYYKTTSGNWDQWSKELYNKNRHLFSIINFSAGYERTWQHFSLEAAPYLKVPMTGIGYGRVKLYGAGIHFTFKYGLK